MAKKKSFISLQLSPLEGSPSGPTLKRWITIQLHVSDVMAAMIRLNVSCVCGSSVSTLEHVPSHIAQPKIGISQMSTDSRFSSDKSADIWDIFGCELDVWMRSSSSQFKRIECLVPPTWTHGRRQTQAHRIQRLIIHGVFAIKSNWMDTWNEFN